MTYPAMQTTRYQRAPRGPNWPLIVGLLVIGVFLAVASGQWVAKFAEDEWRRYRLSTLREKAKAEDAAKTAWARQFTIPELRKRGIVELSQDAGLVEDGAETVLVGTGRDKSNNLRSVFVRFRVATFNGRRQWNLVSVTVEGSPADR